MSERKINLENIRSDVFTNEKYLLSDYDFDILYKYNYIIKDAMKEFGKQLLELAAENAKIDMKKKSQFGKYRKWQKVKEEEEVDLFSYEVQYFVNKQSILDTIKQAE